MKECGTCGTSVAAWWFLVSSGKAICGKCLSDMSNAKRSNAKISPCSARLLRDQKEISMLFAEHKVGM